MNQIRLSAAAVALAALFVAGAQAQTAAPARPAGAPAAQPAAPATQAGPTRIAVIDSRFFRGTDEKGTGGIARYITAARQLEAQFQPQVKDIQGLETRYNSIIEDIRKTQAVAQPAEIEKKRQQAADLEVQIKRKSEDLERTVNSRQEEVMRPIEQDVFNAITAYATQRGYTMVLDVARVPVLFVADQIDITKDFIAEYNRTRPATASTAAPTGSRP
ncbi:MAG TPA: OmpH family outer membrane protein [Pyrinomonadaceae bacterium]|nr:OmpH family outer membrane protein [Pyrinomonadaceae bacterium]